MRRRFDWILPLAAAVTALFFSAQRDISMPIVQMALMMCVTLGMPEALRRACAKSTSQTKVVGLTITALFFTLLVTVVLLALSFFDEVVGGMTYALAVGGILVCIRCVQEYFYAVDDGVSAVLSGVLSAIAITVPTTMGVPGNSPVFVYAVGAVLLVDAVIALIGGVRTPRAGESVRPEFSLFQEVSVAFIRVALYPALAMFLRLTGARTGMVWPICGLLMVELGRTTFRRDGMENAPFAVTVTTVVALAAAAGVAVPWVSAKMIFAAGFALMALYAALSVRTVLAAVVLLLGALAESGYVVGAVGYALSEQIALGLGIAAVLLVVPEWLELFRRMKVARIRRKAMRARKR